MYPELQRVDQEWRYLLSKKVRPPLKKGRWALFGKIL